MIDNVVRGLVAWSAGLLFVAVVLTPGVRRWAYAQGQIWLYLVASACALALVTVPVVRAYARWRGILDQPDARKVHRVPTPLLGGAAVWFAFAVTVLTNFNFSRELKGVALGAALVVAVGIIDDLVDVPAWAKLLGQLAAAAVAMSYGTILTVVPQGVAGSAVLNVVLTAVWFLTVTNAVQFLDGMDGLAAGLGAIACVFFSIAALRTDQPYLMFLSASLLGACLGFLPYNVRRRGATIFLGDSGASLIGFTLAGLAVMGVWSEHKPWVAMSTPILILAVPLFDIAFVSVARVVTGKVHTLHEWLAYTGKDHIHHRLEQMGFTRRQTVLVIFFIAGTLGLSGMLLKDSTPREALVVLLQAGCVLALIAVLEGVGRGRSA
jgi:UDP-GlcNAc:undecaprenyl-phosphate GlcNAc-1-phosphate transferase